MRKFAKYMQDLPLNYKLLTYSSERALNNY